MLKRYESTWSSASRSMSASESVYPFEASPTKVPLPRPSGAGAVHTNQSVVLLSSSIWVAALATPKRKLPLPEVAEVLPIAGHLTVLGPASAPASIGGVTVSPLEQPIVSAVT